MPQQRLGREFADVSLTQLTLELRQGIDVATVANFPTGGAVVELMHQSVQKAP
jgi:hypothetical protein